MTTTPIAFSVPYTSEADAVRAIDTLARDRDGDVDQLAIRAIVTILGIPADQATDHEQMELIEDVFRFWQAHTL